MSAVRKGINSQFIIFIDTGRWSLQPAINPKKSTIYASKDLALNEARKNAQHTRGDIFIFNDKDGSLIAEVKT
jgi:hypothetical protein